MTHKSNMLKKARWKKLYSRSGISRHTYDRRLRKSRYYMGRHKNHIQL